MGSDTLVVELIKRTTQTYKCRTCNGTGREDDDTPCSNPNYAANCVDCDGKGERVTVSERPITTRDI
jgi:DnaJ-class molecular chaperone